ncbi:hypothetical protein BV25DRAFT_1776593, partial [Artomyces pyxidatus]
FQGISLIHNRQTPWHQDECGRMAGIDALLTLGNYTNGTFKLPILRVSLQYNPGTLVLVAGRTFAHEVGEWAPGGNRLCLVHFTHDDVLNEFDIPHPPIF